MLGKVFKAYDVRATYPKPLNEKLSWQIGYGAAQYLMEQAEKAGHDDPMMRHIVVGHDMRKSSPKLNDALKQGIRDFGTHVIDVGLVDTPFVYFAINQLGCAGGVQVTASHNPSNYNGFKISKINAKPVGMTTGLDEIRRYAAMADREKLTAKPGREEKRDLWHDYAEHVRSFLHPKLLDGSRTIKVAIDASNGMAGTMVPKVFGGVGGLKITRLNFDNSSGEFVHEPNPLVESNLEELRNAVIAQKADVGICFDGDADRCVVIDERGQTVGCDHLTAWLAQQFLRENRSGGSGGSGGIGGTGGTGGTGGIGGIGGIGGGGGAAVVFDLRSTKALPEMIHEAGGKAVKSRVGHVFMKQAMAEHKASFGGELSGHFYFQRNFNADSGAIAFACVVSGLVSGGGKPMSELIAPAKRYAQSGEINFETDDKEAAIDDLRRAYPKASIDTLDGITVDMGSWWCNVRPSNTEPLLRLNLEGPDRKTVDALVKEVAQYLGKRVAH